VRRQLKASCCSPSYCSHFPLPLPQVRRQLEARRDKALDAEILRLARSVDGSAVDASGVPSSAELVAIRQSAISAMGGSVMAPHASDLDPCGGGSLSDAAASALASWREVDAAIRAAFAAEAERWRLTLSPDKAATLLEAVGAVLLPYPLTHSLTHSLDHSPTHPPTHSLTLPLTHLLTHSLSYPLTYSPSHSTLTWRAGARRAPTWGDGDGCSRGRPCQDPS
jgi:hypothetical protein